MRGTHYLLLTTVLTLALAQPALAQPVKDYRWEDEAGKRGLTAKEVQLLKQNGFVITGAPLKQVFQAYIGGNVPFFLTTDSLLNGFHVLFEESVVRMETATRSA